MTRRKRRSTGSRKGPSSFISGCFGCLVLGVLVAAASPAPAVEVFIPPLEAAPGDVVEVPVMVDSVENMAGVKLVMTYDPAVLEYKGGGKTGHTDSLMHIINDRDPGRLIAVMAGARGIKGENFPLLRLRFKVSEALGGERCTEGKRGTEDERSKEGKRGTEIRITHVEMMSEQLVPIDCKTRTTPLHIK
jgi:hypothetical protein